METSQKSVRIQQVYETICRTLKVSFKHMRYKNLRYEPEDLAVELVLKLSTTDLAVSNMTAYVNGMIRNKCNEQLRNDKRVLPIEAISGRELYSDCNPLDAILEEERILKLKHTVDIIKQQTDERTFNMLLLLSEGDSYENIAKKMNCDIAKIKNSIYRTRLKIKELHKEPVF
jgi:DNA-directed RNA polymerase specialized sigma24 family protein